MGLDSTLLYRFLPSSGCPRMLCADLLGCACRSEVSAGEAAIAQLERDLAAVQNKLAQAESKVAAAQEDAAEKEKIIK